MKPNITELVVQNDLCIGCGTCDGICPVNVLNMQFNDIGEYIPIESPGCLNKCTLCIDVCPFIEQNDNEDKIASFLYSHQSGIKHKNQTGYYLNSYVCFVGDEHKRLQSASGGITTWLLQKLLQEDIIDYIVDITSTQDSEKLFTYQIHNQSSTSDKPVGSVYYPVEMSEIIKTIKSTQGRYAITGLPCFIKSIRLAQKNDRKLRSRIKYTIGLTCGQMKNKYYTQYLGNLSGLSAPLQSVHYRGKSKLQSANNYYFYAVDKNNNKGSIFWNDGMKEPWVNRWFTPNACNYCDDVYSETADLSVMDAWLPEYIVDYRGHSFIIVRDKNLDDLLKKANEKKEIICRPTSIDQIIDSQAGVLKVKRKHLSYRLFLAKKNNIYAPKKRVHPSSSVDPHTKIEIFIKNKMQSLSKRIVRTKKPITQVTLKKKMSIYYFQWKVYNNLINLLRVPILIFRKIKNLKV